MCFSNLPIEFDERGNPYLADEAEDVDRPGSTAGDVPPGEEGASIEEDPEEAYAEIVASVPDRVRESLGEEAGGDPEDARESARGD